MIEIINLSKIYKLRRNRKEIKALDDVNLTVKEGEIFGLLGPNGAGKTTMIQILTTIKQPTSGTAKIDGFDIIKEPNQAKNRISLMLDSKMLYHRITGYQNLKFFCRIYKVPNYKEKIPQLVEEFGLTKWLNQYVESYSSGMKIKLALCRTLILDRKILFLDEPTLGLDIKSISFIIEKLKSTSKTIFITSHNMSVVEKLCDRVAFINKGKILKVGTKEDIKTFMQKEIKIEVLVNGNKDQLKSELNQESFINNIASENNALIVSLKNRDSYKDLLLILGKYPVQKVKEKELSLEDLFLKII
jgi:ABC-2 type transport system ATP-binding protein